ncbi:hypothetical protein SEA_EVY_149 [Streptomyces phage Evy]|uniref:Uncharacterized protein n=1 Tax=Streptomyces phage Evy TaxID=2588514 RepID=A0A514DK54_9CAUD|nr:hypothetical protein KNU67_gp132 [Streptomyces phage Evy]QDH94000.1 hypothetical protein SEA_EVY_149 [Streptomyces phage Evy]UEM46921.1 hypothetical protein SEA_TARGARYEN_154 [Streptomyces phage Targaryen]
MKFAKGLRPGNRTKYGTVVAAQKQLDGKMQLTLTGRSDNVVLSKYTIVRTIFWS